MARRGAFAGGGLLGCVICALAILLQAAPTVAVAQGPEVCNEYLAPGSHVFEVPDGVTEITADVFGAQGGDVLGTNSQFGTPGLGGGVTGVQIPVTPGELLDVRVGGRGFDSSGASQPAPPGGFNGGGDGAVGSAHTSTSGGGASQINRGTDILVIAGGGGGGAHGGDGGDGGLAGTDGTKHPGSALDSTPGLSGGNGGAGGAGDPAIHDGGDGTSAAGGNPGDGGDGGGGDAPNLPIDGGGGGGGGFVGGGGGGGGSPQGNSATGGGGGSSFDSTGTGTFGTGVQSGNGLVTITYDCSAVAEPLDACVTFDQAGTESFQVPPGVTEIRATVFGAQGGDVNTGVPAEAADGGLGGGASNLPISVTPGETLDIVVGGAGGDATGGGPAVPGGSPGGGGTGGGGTTTQGAGGGGASEILRGATQLVIGGGGGGAGRQGGHGGDGGFIGTNGQTGNGQASPGFAGGYGGFGGGVGLTGGGDGSPGQGGTGSTGTTGVGGGGGGGGAMGGGGGGRVGLFGAGGGGGSSAHTLGNVPVSWQTGVEEGDGRVELAFDCADVATAKTATLLANGNIEYELTVDNLGPNDATGVTVTDALPDVTYISDDCGGVNGATEWTWTIGDLADGGQATCTITVDPDRTGQIDNTACVEMDQVDLDPDNDCDDGTVTVPPEADLGLTKTASAGPFSAGDNVTYTLTATNNGPDTATNVEVTDDLPAGLTFVSATPEQGTCNNADPVDCDLGTIADGDSVDITVVATIGAGQSGNQIDNTACVEGEETDPDDSNDCDTEPIDVEPEADVELTKVASAGPHSAGDNVTYTLTVDNNGPNAAADVEVTDDLPASLTFVSATPSQGTCNAADPLDCDLGTIAANGQATIDLVVTIGADQSGTEIENTACAGTTTTDTDDSNDCDTEPINIDPVADLEIVKTVAPATALKVGDKLTYTLEVTNNGPNDVQNAVVSDTFAGKDPLIVSATPSQGTCTETAPIECELGPLSSGSSATITVVARALHKGKLTNCADATSPAFDPDETNNEDCVSSSVEPARIRLHKAANGSKYGPGDVIRYRISVRSLAAVPLANVRVCDKLPRSLELLAAPGADINGRTSCWTVDLGPNETRTFTVRAKAKPTEHDLRATNTATVTGPENERARDRERVRVKGAPSDTSPEPCRVAARC